VTNSVARDVHGARNDDVRDFRDDFRGCCARGCCFHEREYDETNA